MTESIKIYRKQNKRLGFEAQNIALANLYIDDESLKKLIQHMNRYFYICEDKQSECLLKGTIDPNGSIITTITLLLFIPIAKALLFESFQYIVWEYIVILALGIALVFKEFSRCDTMREKYEKAEQDRNKTIDEIANDFNSRFDYLKMQFNFGMDENEEGFMEIKFFKEKLPLKLPASQQTQQIMHQQNGL